MHPQEQPPEENIRLAADIAEFWIHDAELRRAIDVDHNGQSGDIRTEVLAQVDKALKGNTGNPLDKVIGAVTQITGKSQVRKTLLAYLNNKKPKTPALTTKRPAPKKSDYLPEGAYQLKGQAKRARDLGNHKEALRLILEAYNTSREAQHNTGIIGFIMGCYRSLEDYENVLLYAEKYLILDPINSVTLSMAADSTIKLERYEETLQYVERILKIPNDQNPLKLYARAVLAAYRLRDSEKTLSYAEKALAIAAENGTDDSEVAGILDMANNAAYKLDQFAKAFEYADRYIKSATLNRKNPRAYTIAAFSSYNCEKYTETTKHCELALTNDPNNKAILSLLANAFRKTGETEKFEATKRKLLSIGGRYFNREPGDNFKD